jgi:hypothetical protein
MDFVTGNVDNYLHEAAMANDPPSGTFYHPNGSARLGSLGVHEHWNNDSEKQYTRNLGTGDGIELVQVIHEWGETGPTSVDSYPDKHDFIIFPNPATDIVNVRLSDQTEGNVEIMIFDIKGALLYNENTVKKSYDFIHEIDVAGFSGTLILKLKINNLLFQGLILKL